MEILGKIPIEILKRTVFRWTGFRRRDVILGPGVGEDAAVLSTKGIDRIVVACDPVTGSESRVGWLAVHVNANDVAVCGAIPIWFSSCILLPRDLDQTFKRIVKQIHVAAKELKVSVVTGHSEIVGTIDRPVVIGTMIGRLKHDRYYSTASARVGDKILMTKTAAIEGTAILATDLADILKQKVDVSILRRAARFYKRISVVRDALTVASSNLASAMHDPTEGGILGGLYEMAEASGTGFIVWEDRIPIAEETKIICKALDCDPLKLISSGSLIACVKGNYGKLIRSLKNVGIEANVIGEIVKRRYGRKILRSDGTEESIKASIVDELWRILLKHGNQ